LVAETFSQLKRIDPLNLAEAFLQDQIPVAQRAIIPTTLKNAYAAAALVIANEPIFNIPSGISQHGRVIQLAVDSAFAKLVASGQFGRDLRWRYFEKPTGQYLEVLFSHSALTISQVGDPDKQPRDVGFRRNKRLSSQITMEFMQDGPADTTGLPHILLLHGHQSLNFAHLAIPEPLHWLGFQHKTKNLMLMPHAVPEQEVPMEDTDADAVMSLKEEIDRWMRDNQQ
jgi:hypothetical protein